MSTLPEFSEEDISLYVKWLCNTDGESTFINCDCICTACKMQQLAFKMKETKHKTTCYQVVLQILSEHTPEIILERML